MTHTCNVLLTLAMAVLAGCATLSYETAQEVQGQAREVGREAKGPLTPTIVYDESSQAWVVTATQQHAITIDQETRVQQHVRRYLFWPPAVLPGLIHCPISSLLYVASAGHYGQQGVRLGCHRLIMLEPLEGTGTLPSTITHHTHNEMRVEEVRNAHVEIFTLEKETALLSVPINEKGVGIITVEAVVGALTESYMQPTNLATLQARVVQGSVLKWQGTLPLNDVSLIRQPARPRTRSWPTPAVFQIGLVTGTARDVPLLHTAIMDALLITNQCVVAEARFRETLADELTWAARSRISVTQSLSPGKWIAPTIGVSASIDTTTTPVITLRFTDLKTADVLALQRIPWVSSGFQPLNAVLGQQLISILPAQKASACSSD